MIEISLTAALAIYSAVLGLGAAFIWLYTEIRSRRTYRFLEKQHVWRCAFCAYTYLDEEAENMSQCPRCHSLNDATDKRVKEIQPQAPAPEPALDLEKDQPRRNPSRRKHPGAKNRGPRRRR